jgi:uncharacterized protein YhfF
MNIPAHIALFWQSFVQSQPKDPTPRFYEAFHFDDNERSANELAQLVLAGRKRATAGLVWSFEAKSVPLPKVGDLSVVTNWAKAPLCIIETQRLDIVAFDEVSEEFAATEGESDGSLEYWQTAHWAYFGRECQRIGRSLDPKMPVVCERFEVVFRVQHGTAATPHL